MGWWSSGQGCVMSMADLRGLICQQDHVFRVRSALDFMSRSAVRWQVSSGRWQQPCPGIIVAHSGPITEQQRLWTVLLAAGRGAALAGLTAARLDGFRWSTEDQTADLAIYLLLPAGRPIQRKPPGMPVVVHYSTALGEEDVHPLRTPPRTRIARSLVDAAAWMASGRGAQAVLAAGVQQQLVRAEDLTAVVAANRRLHRRRLIAETLGDIAGGARALSELDFTRLVVRAYRLPEPGRQSRRRDPSGKYRYLDAVWDEQKVVVEIDGSQHMNALHYWSDMERDNWLRGDGYQVLRYPAWAVRYNPGHVAAQIGRALSQGG